MCVCVHRHKQALLGKRLNYNSLSKGIATRRSWQWAVWNPALFWFSLLPPGRREVVWEKEYKGVRWFKSSNPGSVPSSLGDLGWALHPSEHCGHLSNTGSRLSLHSAAGRVKYNNKHLACRSANWVSVSPFRVCWEKRRFFLANRNNCPTFLSIDCFSAPHEHPHLHYACIWPGSTSPVYTSLQLDILSTATKLHPLPSPSYVLSTASGMSHWGSNISLSNS